MRFSNPFTLGGREVRLSASIGIALSATGYTQGRRGVARCGDRTAPRTRAGWLALRGLRHRDSEIRTNRVAAGRRLRGRHSSDVSSNSSTSRSSRSRRTRSWDSKALVRWRHPVLGMIAPVDFIPIAERTGFIVPLGNWILREACLRLSAMAHRACRCRGTSRCRSTSRACSGAIPRSSIRFGEALRDSGLEPQRLVLELTEGIAMANPTAVTTLLMQLRAMGVRISIDDFGTGYSSLAYLRQFPIDTLKIDRSFVRGMVTNKDTAEIVAGVMSLSQQLGLHVVAEGIEHEDQCAQLRALNCDAGQGYLFAKPLDVEAAAERVENRARATAGSASATPLTLDAVHAVRRSGSRQTFRRRSPCRLRWRPRGAVIGGTGGRVRQRPIRAQRFADAGDGRETATGRDDNRSAGGPHVDDRASCGTTNGLPSHPSRPRKRHHEDGVLHRRLLRRRLIGLSSLAAAPFNHADDVARRRPSAPLRQLPWTTGRDSRWRGVRFGRRRQYDTFTLKYTEFLHALSDDTLTLRSATKTYRFKAGASDSNNTIQFRDLADRIERSRR